MAEQRKDKSTRERLDEIEQGYLERAAENRELIEEIGKAYHRFARVTTILLIALAACALVTGALQLYLLNQNGQRVDQIQNQRASFVLSSCREQNHKHDRFITKLDELIAEIDDPAQKAEAEDNKIQTIALVETFVPEQDCAALVRAATGKRPPTATGTTASG